RQAPAARCRRDCGAFSLRYRSTLTEYRDLCRRALFSRLRRRGVRGACARHGARPAIWARSRQDLLDADVYLGDIPRRRANRRRTVGGANWLAGNLLGADWPVRRAAAGGPKNRSRNRWAKPQRPKL